MKLKLAHWLRWWLWGAWRCAHEKDTGRLVDAGLSKMWCCRKCGKCLERI